MPGPHTTEFDFLDFWGDPKSPAGWWSYCPPGALGSFLINQAPRSSTQHTLFRGHQGRQGNLRERAAPPFQGFKDKDCGNVKFTQSPPWVRRPSRAAALHKAAQCPRSLITTPVAMAEEKHFRDSLCQNSRPSTRHFQRQPVAWPNRSQVSPHHKPAGGRCNIFMCPQRKPSRGSAQVTSTAHSMPGPLHPPCSLR